MEREFDIFQRMIADMRSAASCCRQIGLMRGDHRWQKMAELLTKIIENLYELGIKKVN